MVRITKRKMDVKCHLSYQTEQEMPLSLKFLELSLKDQLEFSRMVYSMHFITRFNFATLVHKEKI